MIRKAAIALMLGLAAAPARAAESAPVASPRVTATVLSDSDTAQPGSPLHLALRLRMAPGWHTYWRNPGDAGAEPLLDWALPAGAAAGPVEWPTPQRLPEGPVMAFGYTGDLVLPVTVTPGTGPLDVTLKASWLVCEKICVPEEGAFHLDLPPGAVSASAQAPLIRSAQDRVPRPSPFEARVAPDGTLSLTGTGLDTGTVADAWFFPDTAGVIEHAAPQQLEVAPSLVRLRLRPASEFRPATPLDGVVVLRDPRGDESALQVSAQPGPPIAAATPVWQALALAAVGGLILNLMPCVFPVLAMKAVALARLSGQARGAVRAEAASYTLGVLAAFGALAAVMLAVRAAGGAAGWGFQFQSPVFVAAMAVVLFAVGLNLSGVFTVGSGAAGAGQGLAARRGHAGSFFTGLLAVVVATPCTAPFMGAAVAAGLAAPPMVLVATFLAMGAGLASPYALLALAPRLAGPLPRPGAWMEVLRNLLAFPMYAASVWLVWVVSLQAGPDGVLVTLSALVLVAFAAWAFGAAQGSGRRLGQVAAMLAAVAAVALLPWLGGARPVELAASEAAEAFTPGKLASLRAEGRPVFVNLTAAWCVTCLVNERVALSPAAVRKAFADHHVAYLKGDWTRGDPAITAYLHDQARDGVPLYLLYAPGEAQPTVLPQILTEAEILAQLGKFGA